MKNLGRGRTREDEKTRRMITDKKKKNEEKNERQ